MARIPTLRNIIIGFIFGIFAVQILSLIISGILPTIPLFKGGNSILLILLASGVVAMIILGINIDNLGRRETITLILILFGLIALAYVYLPNYLPQIFSIDPQVSQSIKQTFSIGK